MMKREAKKSLLLWALSLAIVCVMVCVCFVLLALWALHPSLLIGTVIAVVWIVVRYYVAESVAEFIYWKL